MWEARVRIGRVFFRGQLSRSSTVPNRTREQYRAETLRSLALVARASTRSTYTCVRADARLLVDGVGYSSQTFADGSARWFLVDGKSWSVGRPKGDVRSLSTVCWLRQDGLGGGAECGALFSVGREVFPETRARTRKGGNATVGARGSRRATEARRPKVASQFWGVGFCFWMICDLLFSFFFFLSSRCSGRLGFGE